jgi:hypothetical protein
MALASSSSAAALVLGTLALAAPFAACSSSTDRGARTGQTWDDEQVQPWVDAAENMFAPVRAGGGGPQLRKGVRGKDDVVGMGGPFALFAEVQRQVGDFYTVAMIDCMLVRRGMEHLGDRVGMIEADGEPRLTPDEDTRYHITEASTDRLRIHVDGLVEEHDDEGEYTGDLVLRRGDDGRWRMSGLAYGNDRCGELAAPKVAAAR